MSNRSSRLTGGWPLCSLVALVCVSWIPTETSAGIDTTVRGAAGAEATGQRQSTQPAAAAGGSPVEPAVVELRRSGKTKNTLRCWQEGKLILETAGVAPAEKARPTYEMRLVDGADAALHIWDLKHGICMLEVSGQR